MQGGSVRLLIALYNRIFRRYTHGKYEPWTPFDADGYIDWPRLRQEGWHQVGGITDDGNRRYADDVE
jgi:hypothetical protein